MPAIWRTRQRPLTGIARVLVLLAALAGALAPASRGAAEPGPSPSYVKYYVVAAAYQGKPENLPEIAERFLGSTARSAEILNMNAGRPQADGGRLTDPAVLHVGWVLILPWDAVGTGVQYGLLPTPGAVAAKPAPTPPAKPPAKPTAAAAGPKCAGSPKDAGATRSQWAMLRVAPEHAWTYSRGGGVMVAIVDSGVDATLPEFAGHVTVGADIAAGTGRGDTDCLGSGTALAGIVAARSGNGGMVGMAPDATVMPVRVAPTGTAVSEADQASAIEVAVSAGAKVIALGGYVDPARPTVSSAIESAVHHHDVVVVGGAPTRAPGTVAGAGTATPPGTGVLRAGAIGIDGAAGASYQPGTVDVVAPGVDVAGLGLNGTGQFQGSGTQYAVAFVAGEAALVRAMYPNLTAAQVIRRIEATADRMGPTAPDPTYGWGLIDPGVAVTRVIPDEGRQPGPASSAPKRDGSAHRTAVLVIVAFLALLLIILLVLRIRRVVRAAPLAGSAAETVAEPIGGKATHAWTRARGTAGDGPGLPVPAVATAPADTGSADAEPVATEPAEDSAAAGSVQRRAVRARGSSTNARRHRRRTGA